MKKFNHLHVPDQWKQYWSRYPQGYTILEALINWVGQVDDMVDNQNALNKTVDDFRKELDDFVEAFDPKLQEKVVDTLYEWQQSGFLDVVIDQALQTQIDDVSEQLSQIAVNLRSYSHLVTDNDWTLAFTTALDDIKGTGKKLYVPNGEYNITVVEYVVDGSIHIEGESDKAIFKGTDQRLFNVRNAKNITLSNLTFDNFYIVLSGQDDYAYSVDSLTVNNCHFYLNYGVLVLSKTGVKSANIHNNYMDGGFMGFVFGDNSTRQGNWQNISFKQNIIKNLHRDNGSAIHGVIIYGENVYIEDNRMTDFTGVGTVIEAIYTKSKYGVIQNNYLKNVGNVQGSIVIKGRPRGESEQTTPNGYLCICKNNIVICDSSYSTQESIGITVDSEDVLVDGNMIMGVTLCGIDVAGTTDKNVKVVNNTITDIRSTFLFDGIRVRAGSNILLSGNTINNINSSDQVNGVFIENKKEVVLTDIRLTGNTINNLSSGVGYAVAIKFTNTIANNLENILVDRNSITKVTHVFTFSVTMDDIIRIENNFFKDFITRFMTNSSMPVYVKLSKNIGYITEDKGEITIPTGSSYVTVYHNVEQRPTFSDITVSPLGDVGEANYWISNISTTAFRITLSAPTTQDIAFAWRIVT